MLNREKVIGALTACASGNITCKQSGCPYWGKYDDCIGKMAKDALELLKGQEPVEPIYVMICDNRIPVCENCKGYLNALYHYCPMCGRKVKWDE